MTVVAGAGFWKEIQAPSRQTQVDGMGGKRGEQPSGHAPAKAVANRDSSPAQSLSPVPVRVRRVESSGNAQSKTAANTHSSPARGLSTERMRRVESSGAAGRGAQPSGNGQGKAASKGEAAPAPGVTPVRKAPALTAALLRGIRLGQTEAVRRLISNGADVAVAAADSGQTPLHFECSRSQSAGATILPGDEEVVRMLLCAGADAAVSDHGNQTPLHIATEHGRDKVVDLLLEAHRANVSAARLSDGKTPLHLACAGQFGNIEEVVHILLEEANPQP